MANLNLMSPEERAKHEAQERARAEEAAKRSPAEQRRLLEKQIEELNRQEARKVLGARNLTPKQKMLDIDELNADSTEWHYRWLNSSNSAKMATRQAEGYVLVSPGEVGDRPVKLGEMVLARIPRARYEARIRHQAQVTADQLRSSGAELEQALDDGLKEARDRGLSGRPLDPRKVLIRNDG